ncbi:MAG TPA: ABC transporter permease [Candidatus Deferrimicrobium sp.]|nr:ABC transporter permease [Candidatus Deferrimicrobium sp.]
MRLTNIAMGNLKRRKLKMGLLVLGLVIGVASIVGLFSITKAMQEDLANKIDEYGANMLIVPDNDNVSISFGGITVEGVGQVKDFDMSIIDKMRTIKNKETLNIISPKLLADDSINNKQALLVGVQFPEELRLKKWWQINWIAGKKAPTAGEVLVGSEAARVLELAPGNTVKIKGQDFQVAGTIQPTGSSENDSAIFIDLATLQKLTNRPQAVSLVEAAAFCYTCPIFEVTSQLQEKLPGTKVSALKESVQNRDDMVKKFGVFALAVSGIIMIIGALVVLISMLSSVKERTREIGVFRAIGYRKSHVIQIVLTEATILSLIGGIIGYLIGMSVASAFGSVVAQMDVKVVWQPLLALYAIGGAVVIGVVASAIPAWQATRLDPVEALRFI